MGLRTGPQRERGPGRGQLVRSTKMSSGAGQLQGKLTAGRGLLGTSDWREPGSCVQWNGEKVGVNGCCLCRGLVAVKISFEN